MEEKEVIKEEEQLRINDLKELKTFVKGKKLIPMQVNTPGHMEKSHHIIFLKYLGFKNVKEMEDTFFECKFPKGWKYHIPPNSTEWVYLVDNKDRFRGAIFFKVVQKSKNNMKVITFINYMPRYRIIIDRVIPQQQFVKQKEGHLESPLIGKFVDGRTTIFETTPIKQKAKIKTPEYAKEEKRIRDQLYKQVESYAKKLYPEFDNISKYWEDE